MRIVNSHFTQTRIQIPKRSLPPNGFFTNITKNDGYNTRRSKLNKRIPRQHHNNNKKNIKKHKKELDKAMKKIRQRESDYKPAQVQVQFNRNNLVGI